MKKRLLIVLALAALSAAMVLAGCAGSSQGANAGSSAARDDDPIVPDDEAVVIEPISDDDPVSRFAAASTGAVLCGSDTAGGTADMALKNSCYSPLSLYMALAMVGAGAEGEAQQQVLAALNVADGNELERYCKQTLESVDEGFDSYELEIANSIWARNGFAFSKDYLKTAEDGFDAEAFNVDFGTAGADQQMSQWVSDKTKGLLQPTFQTTDAQVAALINTLYYKDAWVDQFNPDSTAPSVFHADTGDVQADFMTLAGHDTSFVKGDGYTAADLAFTGGGFMRFVLPDENVSTLELAGNKDKMAELLNGSMEFARVNWSLPKFTIDSSWDDLIAAMASLGVTDVFSDQKPGMFAGMLDRADGSATAGDFYVSDLIQETHLALDEEGVEAAAYTAAAIETMAALPENEPVDFILDRPFLYIIAAPNGMPLFIGTVENPTA